MLISQSPLPVSSSMISNTSLTMATPQRVLQFLHTAPFEVLELSQRTLAPSFSDPPCTTLPGDEIKIEPYINFNLISYGDTLGAWGRLFPYLLQVSIFLSLKMKLITPISWGEQKWLDLKCFEDEKGHMTLVFIFLAKCWSFHLHWHVPQENQRWDIVKVRVLTLGTGKARLHLPSSICLKK